MKGLLTSLAALLALAIALYGCTASNLAEALKAAGQDNASLCGASANPYGAFVIARSNPAPGTTMSCNAQGGMTITNPPAQIGVPVPITVVPQISVGAPQPVLVVPPIPASPPVSTAPPIPARPVPPVVPKPPVPTAPVR